MDVIVTDKNHKVVTDLKKEDFTILEDGRPQDIQHFSIQALQTGTADPGPAQLRKIPALELAPQPGRTFLILLGRGRHQRFFQGVDALQEFVRKGLLPQDRVAVFAYNRATDFTTQHDRIALFCTNSDNDFMADVWENLDMDLSEETYQRARKEGIPYSVMMPVSPGRRNFKAVIYDIKSDKVGSRVRSIK